MEINYPNQCIVCKSKNKLRCTGCNMISYCGRDHQLEHWSIHKSFCRTISKMLKDKNLSHIYENLNLSVWFMERDKIIHEVKIKLKRSLTAEEKFLLTSPRICFVCREAKQEKLKNCPHCPVANFCNLHPNSYIHDRDCLVMQNRFDLVTRKMNFDSEILQSLIKLTGEGTKILECDNNPPKSMREFLDNYTKVNIKFSEIHKIFLSETFSISLTLYSILQMLYDNLPKEIIIHLNVGSSSAIFIANFWESLLHLLSNVTILKIVYIEEKNTHKEEISLCPNCRSKRKLLSIEANSIPYEKYMIEKNYQKPNLIAYLNVSHPIVSESRIGYINTINKLNELNCPMLLTFLTEIESVTTRKNLLHSSINHSVIFSGYNDFSSLMYHHEQSDGSLNKSSQFMIVFKDQRSNFPESSLKEYWSRVCFYSTICHVCRRTDPKIKCDCKMISYCGNKHRNQDWIHHKDVCKAINALLSEMKVDTFFNIAKFDSNLWLRTRVDAMKEVQMRIGRLLEEYEKQMFYFPGNCSICYDNDPVLRTCKCGVRNIFSFSILVLNLFSLLNTFIAFLFCINW